MIRLMLLATACAQSMLDLGGGWRVSTSWTASDTCCYMELVDKSAWLGGIK